MANSLPDVTILLLARGLIEAYERAITERRAIQQDATMPPHLRRGSALISGLCLTHGLPDLGASLHVLMDHACEPLGNWGLPDFAPPFRFADVVLIDRDLGQPTDDCRELATLGGSESLAQEEIHHEALRVAVQAFPNRERDMIYTTIRASIVRNPVVSVAEQHAFVFDRGLIAAAREIASFYRSIPHVALFDGAARLCGHCGALLWPHRDTRLFPDGQCRIRQCRLEHPIPLKGREVTDPAQWQTATAAILTYWVGPGLDEIRIHDALVSAGRAATLYPFSDAADIGIDGTAIGIDVKSYASPVLLASRLNRSIGRLDLFRRRIVAVPDHKLRFNPYYLEQLQHSYRGQTMLEFMTASQAIDAASR